MNGHGRGREPSSPPSLPSSSLPPFSLPLPPSPSSPSLLLTSLPSLPSPSSLPLHPSPSLPFLPSLPSLALPPSLPSPSLPPFPLSPSLPSLPPSLSFPSLPSLPLPSLPSPSPPSPSFPPPLPLPSLPLPSPSLPLPPSLPQNRLTAEDVMNSDLDYMFPITRVRSVEKLLRTTAHSAFLIVTPVNTESLPKKPQNVSRMHTPQLYRKQSSFSLERTDTNSDTGENSKFFIL